MGKKGKGILAMILASYLMVSGFGCGNTPKPNNNNEDELSYIKTVGNTMVLNNGEIQVVIDKEYGAISSIKNLVADKELVVDNEGLPFSLQYGYNRNNVVISSNSKNKVDAISLSKKDDVQILSVSYNDLKIEKNGDSTGIKAVVNYKIGKGDYFMYNCDFDLTNVSKSKTSHENGIYALKFMDGKLTSAGVNQRLTAPTWNGGQYWKLPYRNSVFASDSGAILSYPGNGQDNLQCGWLDLSAEDGGIGVCLIPKQQMLSEFRIFGYKEDMAMKLSNVHFEPKQVLGQSVPIVAGETFSSDDLVIVAHNGDWHNTADAYRNEYYKAFVLEDGTPDYLNELTVSSSLSKIDFVTRGTNLFDQNEIMTFSKMFEDSKKLLESLDADMSRNAFWLVGQNKKAYAFDVPFMTPTNEQAGGKEGLKQMIDNFHKEGSLVYVYEHPFAVDPDREEIASILPLVDPLQHTEFWNGCNHHSVCIDNSTMKDLWETKVMPPQIEFGIDGWQFDQAPLQQTVCDMNGHNHDKTAKSRLSSHSKAVTKLQQYVRGCSKDGFIVSESRSDICARYCDMAQVCWHVGLLYPENAYYEYGASMYTHPEALYQASTTGFLYDDITRTYKSANMILQDALYGTPGCVTEVAGDMGKCLEFAEFKNKMRLIENNPYYFGFRDNVGLQISNKYLDARVYVKGRNVLVVYLTNKSVDNATIKVDFRKLGFKDTKNKTINVSSDVNKLGYKLFNLDNLEN